MRAGDLIVDRFRPDGLAFRDPLHEIWFGTDTTLDRPVTIRLVTPPPDSDSGWSRRFLDLYRGLAALSHPQIAAILHVAALPDGAHLLVTRPVDGEPLSREPRRREPDQVAHILLQVTSALRAAYHSLGVCHGALTPQNVVADGDRVTVYGFGVASLPRPSPARHLDDLYDLGALAYELLTGRPPEASPPYPEGPIQLASLTMGLLGPPELRPSLDETADRLEVFLGLGYDAPSARVEPRPVQDPGSLPPAPRAGAEPLPDSPPGQPLGTGEWKGPRTPAERHVNVCFLGRQEPLPQQLSLAAGGRYDLRLDIGPHSMDSLLAPGAAPFPAEALPPDPEGHWLTVTAVSDDFAVASHQHPYFLPRTGSGWRCHCREGARHYCSPMERSPYLYLPLAAPARPGPARLRLIVYFRGNPVQSLAIIADVAETERPGAGTTVEVDFSLASGLLGLDTLPARDVSVLATDGRTGTHTLAIRGLGGDTLAFHLGEGQMSQAISEARAALRRVHMTEGPQPHNLLDAHNAKRPAELLTDLRMLAPLGRRLWDLLAAQQDRRALRDRMRAPLTFQVVRGGPTTFVFPWALVYDIPLDGDPAGHRPCQVVDGLGPQAPPTCPYENEHTLNTLCPYGFWGFRHLIEQPPSMPSSRTLPVSISSDTPADLVLGISRDLEPGRTERHLSFLGSRLPGVRLDVCDSRSRLMQSLGRVRLPLVYLYCHGRRGDHGPYLEVGHGEKITPGDLSAWSEGLWPPDHWLLTPPLVFINGCHTVELTPDSLTHFVDAFAGAQAAGVIGTETAIHQNLAGEVAELFLLAFRSGATVGEALAAMRLALLAKGNLLGLAFTAYCSADLRLLTGG